MEGTGKAGDGRRGEDPLDLLPRKKFPSYTTDSYTAAMYAN